MGETISSTNPAFRGVKETTTNFQVPSVGEVFFTGGSNEKYGDRGFMNSLYIRTADGIKKFDPIKEYQNTPQGKLLKAGAELKKLFGVNGALGGNWSGAAVNDPNSQQRIEQSIRQQLQDAGLDNSQVNQVVEQSRDSEGNIMIGRSSSTLDAFDSYAKSQGAPISGVQNYSAGDLSKAAMEAIASQLQQAGIDPSKLPTYNPEVLRMKEVNPTGDTQSGSIQDITTAYQAGQPGATGYQAASQTQQGEGAADRAGAEAAGTWNSQDSNYMTTEQQAALDKGTEFEQGTPGVQMGAAGLGQDKQAGQPQGTVPGYKGIYDTVKTNPADQGSVNELFQAYHGRPANEEEVAYWSGKTVGELEDTLAKTQIFSGEDADKIRQQMMDQGLTYIRNQADLEQLAQAGQVSPETLQSVSQQGGMMFTPTQQAGTQPGGATGTMPGGTAGTGAGAGAGTGIDGGAGTGIDGGAGGMTTDPNGEAMGMIDNSNLPDDLKMLFKEVVSNYPDGIEYDAGEILSTFDRIKNDTIDPYFRELATIAQDKFNDAYENLQLSRTMDLEKQRFMEGNRVKQARAGLEKAGMTFTGKAIEELGQESAYARPAGEATARQPGDEFNYPGGSPYLDETTGQYTTGGGVPEQTPFGGLFYEGNIPMQNRWIRTSSQARYNDALKQLGRGYEEQYGTQGYFNTGGIAGYTPLGGVEGNFERDRQGQYANTLSQLVNTYQDKQGLLTDI